MGTRVGEAGEAPSGGHQRIGRSTHEETTLSETRKYRKFTPQQKLELVMASWRGERSIAELCREHDISESLLRRWREQAFEAGMERFAAGEQRSQGAEPAVADRQARARLGAQELRVGDRGKALAGLGVGMRVTRSRELVAEGYRPSAVARVAQISRQANH